MDKIEGFRIRADSPSIFQANARAAQRQEWRQLITENPNNMSVTASFDLPDDLPVKVGDDSVQVLTERHRYAVTAYDAQRRTYIIKNPWNSEKNFEINAEYFDYYARDVINHA
jgi:hypothetical protein